MMSEATTVRVTAFSIKLAYALSQPTETIRIIARGAFLHDIGKLAISNTILLKPGPLTETETAVIHEHCYNGFQMLRKIPFLKAPAEIVYSHHERWDGTGYPRGLKARHKFNCPRLLKCERVGGLRR